MPFGVEEKFDIVDEPEPWRGYLAMEIEVMIRRNVRLELSLKNRS